MTKMPTENEPARHVLEFCCASDIKPGGAFSLGELQAAIQGKGMSWSEALNCVTRAIACRWLEIGVLPDEVCLTALGWAAMSETTTADAPLDRAHDAALDAAARELDRRLREFPWYLSTGIAGVEGKPTLVVFAHSQASAPAKAALMSKWMGFDVVARVTGASASDG